MAARELVLLSSSPPRIPDSDIIITPPSLREGFNAHATIEDPNAPQLSPTSPDLPSPTALFRRKPQGLKSGSRAAEIPHGASFGFASAGALVRERRLSLGGEEAQPTRGGDKKDATEEAPKPKKRAQRKAVAADEGEPETKKPRKRNATAEGEGESAPAKKTTKRKKVDTEIHGSASTVLESKVAGKPRKRTMKPALNNSELIKEALSLGTDSTAEVANDGAVKKLQKLKAKANTAQPPTALSADGSISTEPKEAEPQIQKPRKRGTKNAGQDLVSTSKSAAASKATACKPAVRKTSEKTSKHFSRDVSIDTAVVGAQEVQMDVPEQPLDISRAMVRRLSWTPPKDTKSSPDGQSLSNPIETSGSPADALTVSNTKPSFANLLTGFGYSGQASDSPDTAAPRTESGEAFTTRRKLEVYFLLDRKISADFFQLVEKPQSPVEPPVDKSREPSPEKPEKPQKRKPRTITDLATAAYRPVAPPPVPGETIDPKASAFFAPRSGSESLADPATIPIPKGRKGAARSKSPSKKSKSTAKSKKATKTAAEKLLSPETALLKMDRQDLLFGTSSQLTREDSPTFIRDLQKVLQDSEIVGTQIESVETLHIKPAVSGSGLCLVGRRKGLWGAAARDLDDGILREEEKTASEPDVFVEDSLMILPNAQAKAPSPTQAQPAATLFDGDDMTEERRPALPRPGGDAFDVDAGSLPEAPHMPYADVDHNTGDPTVAAAQPSSDYVDIDEYDRRHPPTQQDALTIPSSPVASSLISPEIARRTVLQPLSSRPNIPILTKSVSDITGVRAKSKLTSKAANLAERAPSEAAASPPKRPRGRPRKEVTCQADSIPVKSGRGRPRKSASPQPETSTSRHSVPPAKAATKGKAKSRAAQPSGKAVSSRAEKPTTPRKRKAARDEEWPDIDEIEDSEEEISPSPPRRKKISAASPSLTLSLSQEAPAAESAPAEALAPVSPSRKRKGKNTSHIPKESLEAVCPQITTAVKAAPPSHDPLKPSWYEKMLLYDPIVVEDFTKWLNGKEIRVGVVVPVPKPAKKRGKKKQDEEHDTPSEEESERTEMQELPGWVVQRWCEENSVCCIYKESLWNGRRARY